LVVAITALAGLFVGSFLNVVVYRVPRHLSISKPRSFCPTCQRQLAWWENVPLVSWAALGGHCHVCKEPISARYPVVEAATALSFGLIAIAWSGSTETIAYCILAASLLVILIIDIGTLRSPLVIAGIGTALGDVALVAATVWSHHWAILVTAQVGLVVGCAGFAVLRRVDPECLRPEGFGRSALIPAGCWLGGLWAVATLVGLAAAVIALGLSLTLRHWSPMSPSGSVPDGPTNLGWQRINRIVRLPLVTSVAVGVTMGLVVHA